jgi:hypothetical protein
MHRKTVAIVVNKTESEFSLYPSIVVVTTAGVVVVAGSPPCAHHVAEGAVTTEKHSPKI